MTIIMRRAMALILGATLTGSAGIGFAFDMGNMMNRSKWMGGGNRNRDRDYDEEGPWGGYGGPGGYGASPMAVQPSAAPHPPSANPAVYGSPNPPAASQSEIESLKERLRILERPGIR